MVGNKHTITFYIYILAQKGERERGGGRKEEKRRKKEKGIRHYISLLGLP